MFVRNEDQWLYTSSGIYVGYRTSKPVTSTEYPRRNSKNEQTANCNGRIVECLIGDGIGYRQREEDWDGYHPKNGNPSNQDPIAAQIEGSWSKRLACQSHPEEDG